MISSDWLVLIEIRLLRLYESYISETSQNMGPIQPGDNAHFRWVREPLRAVEEL